MTYFIRVYATYIGSLKKALLILPKQASWKQFHAIYSSPAYHMLDECLEGEQDQADWPYSQPSSIWIKARIGLPHVQLYNMSFVSLHTIGYLNCANYSLWGMCVSLHTYVSPFSPLAEQEDVGSEVSRCRGECRVSDYLVSFLSICVIQEMKEQNYGGPPCAVTWGWQR